MTDAERDNAVAVLKWLTGRHVSQTASHVYWHDEDETPRSERDLGLEFIFRTLIPALEERLGLITVTFFPRQNRVVISVFNTSRGFVGEGPTFESAFLASAAKAVSDE